MSEARQSIDDERDPIPEGQVLAVPHWRHEFEVSDKARAAKPGDILQAGPLRYIRLPAAGEAFTRDYRALLAVAGDKAMAVYGCYVRLLGMTAAQVASRRGKLLTHDGRPADCAYLALATGFAESEIRQSVKVLTHPDIGWLECVDIIGDSQIPTDSREFPGPVSLDLKGEVEGEVEGECTPSLSQNPLGAEYDAAWEAIRSHHKADKRAAIPRAGSGRDKAQRAALAKLEQPESTSLKVVLWVFTSDDKDALFWRKSIWNFESLHEKCKDGKTKFQGALECYQAKPAKPIREQEDRLLASLQEAKREREAASAAVVKLQAMRDKGRMPKRDDVERLSEYYSGFGGSVPMPKVVTDALADFIAQDNQSRESDPDPEQELLNGEENSEPIPEPEPSQIPRDVREWLGTIAQCEKQERTSPKRALAVVGEFRLAHPDTPLPDYYHAAVERAQSKKVSACN